LQQPYPSPPSSCGPFVPFQRALEQPHLGLHAPAEPGVYELRVTLVQEGVAWFDELHPENALRTSVRIS